MIEIPTSPDYSKNAKKVRGEDYPCVVCGKPVKCDSRAHRVYVGAGGSHLLLEAEAEEVQRAAEGTGSDGGFMGLYPLGQNCLRRHPELRPYAIKAAA